ncbi:MAG TPA: hypothetical protein VGU45_04965 [Microvirga sp.]|jgi:hypothetical protein|nr:hypothetical protein [Microvirga sp.]
MKIGCLVALAAALGGCASVAEMDRHISSFNSHPDGTFRFRGTADIINTLDSEHGETYRVTMLESWMRTDGVCPKGYTITSRRAVARQGINAYDVVYDGKCK